MTATDAVHQFGLVRAGGGRDPWSWLDTVITAASGCCSAITGLLAVGLAYLAWREAIKARKAVADERRRTFELDVLARLIESAELLEMPTDVLVNRHLYIARNQGRLALIPLPELPRWHALLNRGDTFDVLIDDAAERAALRAQYNGVKGEGGYQVFSSKFNPLLRTALVKDVLSAIDARMAP